MSKLDRCNLLAGDECTSLAGLREQNEDLQTLVAGMREAIAKDLFLSGKLPNEPKHYECRWCKQWAFSPELIEHEEGCIFFLLSAPTAGEWVVVKKKDAVHIKAVLENDIKFLCPECKDIIDRLTAALGTRGKE